METLHAYRHLFGPGTTIDLEADVPLDGDVGAADGVAVDGHVDGRLPGTVVPLHVDGVVGLQGGGEGVVVSEVPLPLDRHLAGLEGEGGSDAVVGVDLLRNGDGLLVLASDDLDVGLSGVVADGHVDVLGGDVEGGRDSDAGVLGGEALGGLDGAHRGARGASTGQELEGNIVGLAVGVDLDGGVAQVLLGDVGAGRDSPGPEVPGRLAPEGAGHGGNVAGGHGGDVNSGLNVVVAGGGGGGPREGGVEAIEAVEGPVLHLDCEKKKKEEEVSFGSARFVRAVVTIKGTIISWNKCKKGNQNLNGQTQAKIMEKKMKIRVATE